MLFKFTLNKPGDIIHMYENFTNIFKIELYPPNVEGHFWPQTSWLDLQICIFELINEHSQDHKVGEQILEF